MKEYLKTKSGLTKKTQESQFFKRKLRYSLKMFDSEVVLALRTKCFGRSPSCLKKLRFTLRFISDYSRYALHSPSENRSQSKRGLMVVGEKFVFWVLNRCAIEDPISLSLRSTPQHQNAVIVKNFKHLLESYSHQSARTQTTFWVKLLSPK